MLELNREPHRRFNPLKKEWVLVSPHRTQRPWQGQVEESAPENLPAYDPQCYLCPSNERAAHARNPDYTSTFVFDNDFPALLPRTPDAEFNRNDLLRAEGEPGVCRVVCFSPKHNLTIARMKPEELTEVVDVWAEQYSELGALDFINSVQIFENRGAMMGASNPHPHCQIWASRSLPDETAKELTALSDYAAGHGSCLLCDYLNLERETGERLVCENRHFAALVPFWAVWPFETLIVGRRHTTALDELTNEERAALADILKQLTTRYDNLFRTSFPYSMGFHNRPTDNLPHAECHLHAHFYPPLLRSATVRKFMVGFELLGTPQRDITAEAAADRLREVSDRHFLES